jgi:hypothetical protein
VPEYPCQFSFFLVDVWTQGLMLARQVLYCLSHASSHTSSILIVQFYGGLKKALVACFVYFIGGLDFQGARGLVRRHANPNTGYWNK